jgi:hypothetical protein
MNEEIHRHLDGHRQTELEPEHRDQVDEWERMIAAFRSTALRGTAPSWLEQRVMSEIEALPQRGPLQRLASWLVSPAPVRISPLGVGAGVAVLVTVLLLSGRGVGPEVGASGAAVDSAQSVVYIQFVLEAPTASSVAVAGDFSEWEPTHPLEDLDGDGVWTGRVPVRPGVHGYMFLIDGTEWQTDPHAERYQDDGFGNRNAILAVASGA